MGWEIRETAEEVPGKDLLTSNLNIVKLFIVKYAFFLMAHIFICRNVNDI